MYNSSPFKNISSSVSLINMVYQAGFDSSKQKLLTFIVTNEKLIQSKFIVELRVKFV